MSAPQRKLWALLDLFWWWWWGGGVMWCPGDSGRYRYGSQTAVFWPGSVLFGGEVDELPLAEVACSDPSCSCRGHGATVELLFTTHPSVPSAFFQSHGVYETSPHVSGLARAHAECCLEQPLHEQLQVTILDLWTVQGDRTGSVHHWKWNCSMFCSSNYLCSSLFYW